MRHDGFSRLDVGITLQWEKLTFVHARQPDAKAEGWRVRIRPRTPRNPGNVLLFCVPVARIVENGRRAEHENMSIAPAPYVRDLHRDGHRTGFFRQHDDFTLEATGQLGKDDILPERGRRDQQQQRREEFCRHHSTILPPRFPAPCRGDPLKADFPALFVCAGPRRRAPSTGGTMARNREARAVLVATRPQREDKQSGQIR